MLGYTHSATFKEAQWRCYQAGLLRHALVLADNNTPAGSSCRHECVCVQSCMSVCGRLRQHQLYSNSQRWGRPAPRPVTMCVWGSVTGDTIPVVLIVRPQWAIRHWYNCHPSSSSRASTHATTTSCSGSGSSRFVSGDSSAHQEVHTTLYIVLCHTAVKPTTQPLLEPLMSSHWQHAVTLHSTYTYRHTSNIYLLTGT